MPNSSLIETGNLLKNHFNLFESFESLYNHYSIAGIGVECQCYNFHFFGIRIIFGTVFITVLLSDSKHIYRILRTKWKISSKKFGWIIPNLLAYWIKLSENLAKLDFNIMISKKNYIASKNLPRKCNFRTFNTLWWLINPKCWNKHFYLIWSGSLFKLFEEKNVA